MFFITFSNLWSFSYFFYFTYITAVLSVILYLLPVASQQGKYSFSRVKTVSDILTGFDLIKVTSTPYILLLMVGLLWSAPSTSIWFGHLVISNFQHKIYTFILVYFLLVLNILLTTTYFSSREVFDYIISTCSFVYWVIFLSFSNSFFTALFIIEVLSSLSLLLLATSTFSTSFFYRNLDFNFGGFFQMSTPYAFLQSIIYFFWMSMIASINLFIFLILLYTKLPTLDWNLIEYLFTYFINTSSFTDILSLGVIWAVLMFSIFLKCGIAPFYIWKPTFFKGIPVYTLFFYVCFFYFFIFLYFIYFISTFFSEIFFYFLVINILFVLAGLGTLLAVLVESYYLKSFMAMSSILNSLFVIMALASTHTNDIFLYI